MNVHPALVIMELPVPNIPTDLPALVRLDLRELPVNKVPGVS